MNDVAHIIEQMEKEGASILVKPEKQFWGDLKARIKDPFGYIWDVAQPL
ncbi:VOC family protein [Pseudomonas sp. NPDC086278]